MGQLHGIQAEEHVIDASAAFEYLLNAPKGQRIAELIQDIPPIAPEMLDAEVLSALRSAVMRGEIDEAQALEDLAYWLPNATAVPADHQDQDLWDSTIWQDWESPITPRFQS